MKKKIVTYYCWPNISDEARSILPPKSLTELSKDAEDSKEYLMTKTKLSSSQGYELKDKYMYARAFTAKGIHGNPDSVWISATIKTSPKDIVIGETNFDQDVYKGVAEGSRSYVITGAKGKFEGAKEMIIDYDNAKIADWTPEWMKKGPVNFFFRRVTILF